MYSEPSSGYSRDRFSEEKFETTYRFLVDKKRGVYTILIGLKGMKKEEYIPISKSAFYRLSDRFIFETENGAEAQFNCKKIRDWFIGQQEQHYNQIRLRKKKINE